MATLAERLADAQRASQARLAAALVAIVSRAYLSALQPGRIEFAAFERWLAQMLPVILDYRRQSEALARVYLRQLGLPPEEPENPSDDAIRTALLATGWAGLLEQIGDEIPETMALERAAVVVEGVADKHALNGGRSTVLRTFERTRSAWYRVTREGCCYFCAALASRGAVYQEDSFADSDPRFTGPGEVKVHDTCHCSFALLPDGESLPGRIGELSDLWKASTQGFSGNDAMNAFRRAYERPELHLLRS